MITQPVQSLSVWKQNNSLLGGVISLLHSPVCINEIAFVEWSNKLFEFPFTVLSGLQ